MTSTLAALMMIAAATSDPCEDMMAGRAIPTISAEAFSLKMEAAAPNPKSEYETTAAYEARSNQKLQAFLNDNPYIAFRKEIIYPFRYNADTQQLIYQDSEYSCDRAQSAKRQCGIYAGRSLLGLKSYKISFTPPSHDFTPYPTISASPDRAREIRNYLELIMVVVPEAPYLIKERQVFADFQEITLPVRLLCTGWSIETER